MEVTEAVSLVLRAEQVLLDRDWEAARAGFDAGLANYSAVANWELSDSDPNPDLPSLLGLVPSDLQSATQLNDFTAATILSTEGM